MAYASLRSFLAIFDDVRHCSCQAPFLKETVLHQKEAWARKRQRECRRLLPHLSRCTFTVLLCVLMQSLGVLPSTFFAASQADLEQSNEPPQSFTRPTEDGWEKQPNTTETEADTQTSQASPFEGPPSVSGESPAAVAGGECTRVASCLSEVT